MDTLSLKKNTGQCDKETWLELTIQLCLHELWTNYKTILNYDQWLHYNQFQSIEFFFFFHLDVVLRFHCLFTVSVGVSRLFSSYLFYLTHIKYYYQIVWWTVFKFLPLLLDCHFFSFSF